MGYKELDLNSDQHGEGFMASEMTTDKGRRADTYRRFLGPLWRRENLKIARFSHVIKVFWMFEVLNSCLNLDAYQCSAETKAMNWADPLGPTQVRLWRLIRPPRNHQVCSCKQGNHRQRRRNKFSPAPPTLRHWSKKTLECQRNKMPREFTSRSELARPCGNTNRTHNCRWRPCIHDGQEYFPFSCH